MKSKRLRRRFTLILIIFSALVLISMIVYHNTVSTYLSRTMRENIVLTESNLLSELNGEFSRLKVAATVIGSSIYVQEFLAETNIDAYLSKTGAVSEIISKTVYPSMSGDCIYTISANGSFYRYTGGVSSDAFESVYRDIINGGSTIYAVVELGGTGYFCLSSPVYTRGSVANDPVGYVVILSNLTNARRALTKFDTLTGIDTAVIVDGVILFSSNPALDGEDADELDRLYGSVTIERVTGSNMYAAAMITNDVLYLGERLFLTAFIIILAVLLAAFVLLYRVLSTRMVSPMLESADNMRLGLLKTQIDAHFVVNTISCIEGLANQGKTEKIAEAAQNLAHMLNARHQPDDEVNVFEQLEDAGRYLRIMNIRSDGKFNVEMDADDELLRCRMLVQVLQPLIENALTHGLGNKKDDCRLNVTGKIESNNIIFEVSDNGMGIEPEPLRALQEALETDDGDYAAHGLKGVALVNIQKRIRAMYGKQYGLTVNGGQREGFTVTVRLPFLRDKTPQNG